MGIDLLLTDPPYNVNISNEQGKTIMNDNMSKIDFQNFLESAFRAADEAMRPGAVFYVWHADNNGLAFRSAAENIGWVVRQCLIWNKNSFTLGRQDYQWKHEPCLYGWKEGAGHYFFDSRREATVLEDKPTDLKKLRKDEMLRLLQEIFSSKKSTTIIDCDRPAADAEHPTMKPVRLIGYLMRNSSRRGEAVFDPFGGSGTTMIAAEQLGRKCYMMDLVP